MANEQYKAPVVNLNKDDSEYVDESIRSDYLEETSAEFAAPIGLGAYDESEERAERATGTGVGWLAVILSILSLFFATFLLGATGIILGFIARGRGARSLGSWAIGIGVVSIVLSLFILPFFF